MKSTSMENDSSKRQSLKLLAVATGAMAVPGLAIAACNHGNTKQASMVKKPVTSAVAKPISGSGLVVSFDGMSGINGAQQITVTNTTNKAITLTEVYPGIVSTPDGQFDLNSILENGSKTFAPKQANTLTIPRLSSQAAKTMRTKPASIDASRITLAVNTHSPNVNHGAPVTTIRSMLAYSA